MNRYLVDTNVLSELTKPAPNPTVVQFLRDARDQVFVSVLSIGEIKKGISSLPLSNRRVSLEDWLDNEIRPWFSNRILAVDLPIAERWGELSAQLKATGRPRPVVDAILSFAVRGVCGGFGSGNRFSLQHAARKKR